jgi:hypothetical protein
MRRIVPFPRANGKSETGGKAQKKSGIRKAESGNFGPQKGGGDFDWSGCTSAATVLKVKHVSAAATN